jgi:hypothetical protein
MEGKAGLKMTAAAVCSVLKARFPFARRETCPFLIRINREYNRKPAQMFREEIDKGEQRHVRTYAY